MTKGVYEWKVETRDPEGFHLSYWDSEADAYDIGTIEKANPAVVDVVIHKWDDNVKHYFIHEVLKGDSK